MIEICLVDVDLLYVTERKAKRDIKITIPTDKFAGNF
jgi:hypothetical protein